MCLSPIRLKNPSLDKSKVRAQPFIDVPCGKCSECLSKRRREWVLRLKLEYEYCLSCFSFTLTYDDAHLPENGKLSKRDVQLFLKRLRHKNLSDRSLKYFIVGEYGDKLGRPHYHCILFNLVVDDLYKTFSEVWPAGLFEFGDNKGAAFAYAAKYYIKPSNDCEKKPFTLVSKGIGCGYLTENNVTYHENTCDLEVVTFDGQKYFMPRYLRQKIWSRSEDLRNIVHFNIDRLYSRGILRDINYDPSLVALAKNNKFDNVQRRLHHK